MILSKGCEYGLRAILYIAAKSDTEGRVLTSVIADELDIPYPYLTKLMRNMKRAKLIDTRKGPGGGVCLARPAEKIALLDVVAALDGTDMFRECLIGVNGCSEGLQHCPVHDRWASIRTNLHQLLDTCSLADCAANLKDGSAILQQIFRTGNLVY